MSLNRSVPLACLLAATVACCLFPVTLAQSPGLPSNSALPSIAGAQGKLQVYFVDVEGGQATLFVTPSGKSMLIDTGWPGRGGRDADRIVAAAKDAGIAKLDFVLITHFHDDHVGGVPQLASRIPIGTFIDHGANRELDGGVTEHGYAAYQGVLSKGKYGHIVARPGMVLPIEGMEVTVLSADGDLLQKSLAGSIKAGGGEANPFCKAAASRPADRTENARSLGVQINFGALRMLDLGDLTADKEMQLVCPANLLGREDVYIVSHHGWMQSSSPAMVDALHARVAIMDNGETKGGSLPVMETLLEAPGLETLWQLHSSAEGGPTHNTSEPYLANPLGTEAGHFLKLTGARDGSFDILNGRTKFVKHYPARNERGAAGGKGSILPSKNRYAAIPTIR